MECQCYRGPRVEGAHGRPRLCFTVTARVAQCPNCGGGVEFKAGTSLLSVCPYCSSVVARTGDDVGALEILGQVAPLAALGSPLRLGLSGRYRGQGFTLVGRLQLDYGAGPWNEWYAAFDSGRWGWLAEAQGRVYFTFQEPREKVPTYLQARVGTRFRFGGGELTVVERRRARFISAEGELPSAIVPGRWYRYVDLEGEGGAFGTLDYGDGDEAEALYVGEQLSYAALFDASVLGEDRRSAAAGVAGLNCPNCGGAVELRAPNEAMRVTCPSCDALLDCEAGSLRMLSALQRRGPEPKLTLGVRGRIRDVEYVIFAHLVRSVSVEGVVYPWEEYLLRGPAGWRWLVVSDGHWSFVEPVSVGEVRASGQGAIARGTLFRHFQSAAARVEAIRGELYWKVAVGETVRSADFIAPPRMLSMEASDDEITWSLGQYLEPGEVEKAFGLKTKLPRPRGVGACQPNPAQGKLKARARTAILLSAILGLFTLVFLVSHRGDVIYTRALDVPAATSAIPSAARGAQVITGPFEISKSGNVAIEAEVSPGVGPVFISGELIDQTSKARQAFGLRVEDTFRSVLLGPAWRGTYALAFTPEYSTDRAGGSVQLRVKSNVFVESHAIVTLLLLWIPAVLELVRMFAYEKSRWAESDHG